MGRTIGLSTFQKMLKKLKHSMTAMGESMKRKSGPMYLNPNYEIALEHYNKLCESVKQFTADANLILSLIPRVFKSAQEFSGLTERSFETFPETDRTLSAQVAKLTVDIQLFVSEKVANQSVETVMNPLKTISANLDELRKTKELQKHNFLILESNKSKLEGYQKKGDKKAADADRYSEKVNTRTAEVVRLETEFINGVAELWKDRFELVGKPMAALMDIVVDIGKALATASGPIARTLGPEWMDKNFPGDPSAVSTKSK